MAYQVPRMDPVESRAWLALIGTIELLPTALDAHLQAESGLTHFEFIVLSILKQTRGGTLRMKDLAAAADATLPRLSKVVTRMAARDLVSRRAGDGDGRAVEVQLTKAGRRALVLATPGHIAQVRGLVLDGLTPEQLTTLAEALEPIVAKLDPHQRLLAAGFAR